MAERTSAVIDGVSVVLTHLDRALYPDGFTKSELIWYYQEVAPVLLPQLEQRCVTRVRFPDGVQAASFYEKNLPQGAPSWLESCAVASSEGSVDYLVVSKRADLAWLANMSAIELHTPQWRIDHATQGERGIILEGANEPLSTSLMVDLDPGEGIEMADSAKGAILAATALAERGLETMVKTSGNKGLQLSVPIAPTPASQVRDFATQLARDLVTEHPHVFVHSMAKDQRIGKIFIDSAQNKAARNTICAYSMRGVDSPRIATPITWDEVAAAAGRRHELRFSPFEVVDRLAETGDPWAGPLPRQVLP